MAFFGNRKVEDEGANERVLIRGVVEARAPRVIFTSCKKILPGNARVQFSRVTLYETAIQQNQAKFNQLIKREAKCKI